MKIKTLLKLIAFGQTSIESLHQCSADGGAGDRSVTTLQLGKSVSFVSILGHLSLGVILPQSQHE